MPRIYWQQQYSGEVEAWEFQRSVDGQTWEWVEVTDASLCETCFTAQVFDDKSPAYYRARSISAEQEVSEWSNRITLPEPNHDVMVAFTFVCLTILYYFTRKF